MVIVDCNTYVNEAQASVRMSFDSWVSVCMSLEV